MKTWQEVKESPNYKRLKDSLELRCARRNLLACSIATAFCALISLIPSSMGREASSMILFAMTLLILLPCALFYLYRIFRIFHHIDGYAFTEVVLDTPRSGMGRNSMYFEITVRDRFGSEVATQTHEIFTTHGEGLASLEEYTNKKVLIGYNQDTGFVAVIG